MLPQEFEHLSASEMADALRALRQRARVQSQLMSLDAKARWRTLELDLLRLELKLEVGGEEVARAAGDSFGELVRAANELLGELDERLELATPVRVVMCDLPKTCSAEETLDQAAKLMWESDCGAVPVVEADGSVIGIITDRDVCMAAHTRRAALWSISIGSTMSTNVQVCSPSDSLGDALRAMAFARVRRLPVVDDGKLVGLVSLADIIRQTSKIQENSVPACVALTEALAEICSASSAPAVEPRVNLVRLVKGPRTRSA
jgi:CBS domain-containing protein